jgi:tetratricopeptide (TPR) repeat protein
MTTYLSLCSFGLRSLAFSSATIAATLAFSGMARAQAPVETRKPVEAPAVSRLLPDSIVGLFLVNPEPKLWQDLAKFKTFPRDVTTPGWMFSTLVPELSYHGDIAPWIGGSVATVLLFNPDQTANVYATIAPVRDASQMPKFFDRVKRSRQGKLPTTRLYNGTSILFWEPEKVQDFSFEFGSEETTEVTVEADPNSKAGTAAEKAGEAAGKAGEAAKKAGTAPKKTTKAPKKADKTELKTDEAVKEAERAEREAADRAPLPLPTIEPNQSPEEPKPKSKPKKTIEVGGFAAAYLKSGFVVTSESLAAVQQLIDAETGTTRRLIDVPGFQRMIQDDRYPKSLISGYANLASLMRSSKLNTPKELAAFNDFPLFQNQSPEQLTQLIEQGSDGIDGFVWAPPEGIQAQVGVHFKGTIAPALIARTNSPNALISRVPAINYGMSGSTNLAFFWRAFTTAMDSNKTTKNGLKGFRDFSQGLVGIDDRDIFPWMDKEYMGFAFPAQGSPLTLIEPKLAVGFGGFFQTSDRTAATTALKKVETALTKLSKGEVKITTRKIGDQSLTSWEVPGPSATGPKPSKTTKSKPAPGKPVSVFAYQWVADDTLAILSGADTSKNLLPKPWQPLDQAINFKEAIAPLPPENMGYFYLNPPVVLALANQFGLTKMFQSPTTETDPELDLGTAINSIFSVAGTSALQPKQLTSEGYAKLATRPIPKLTAQEFIDRAKLKVDTDTDWAIANYSRALSLDANNADAFYGRATAQSQNNNPQGAIEDYDRTLQLEPKKVQAYLDRAKSKTQTYDYLGTFSDASQALGLTQEKVLKSDAYYLRSVSQFNQGNYTAALEDLAQVTNPSTEVNPKRNDSLNLKCFIQARSAKPEALKTCNEAVEVEALFERPGLTKAEAIDPTIQLPEPTLPAELSAHRCLARAQAKEPKAFQDCGKALTKEPENPVVHEVQGLARLVAGDRKGAIFSLEKALTLYTQLGDKTAIDRVQTKLTQNR